MSSVPFVSLFILKLFLISLLTTTTNAETTNNESPVTIVCPKTKNPKQCFKILENKDASSLHVLGVITLNLADDQGKTSEYIFKTLLTRKDLTPKQKTIYNDCRHNYVVAREKLYEAETAWIDSRNYALARTSIEVAYKVPSSCEKELIGAPQSPEVVQANEMSDLIFEILLVTANEIIKSGGN